MKKYIFFSHLFSTASAASTLEFVNGLKSLNLGFCQIKDSPSLPRFFSTFATVHICSLSSFIFLVFDSFLKDHNHLTHLYLDGNHFGMSDLTGLTAALRTNKKLKLLSLRQNILGDKGLVMLGKDLINSSSVEFLDISENRITDRGVASFCGVLDMNRSIISLAFAGNEIEDSGCVALAKLISKKRSFRYLDLSNNEIGDEGCVDLARAIGKCEDFWFVSLGGNEIEDGGCDSLTRIINKNHPSLSCVLLEGNDIEYESLEKFVASVQSNTLIEEAKSEDMDESVVELLEKRAQKRAAIYNAVSFVSARALESALNEDG